MGIDFVRSRESHLTITHDAVYRKLYKVIESESFALGDRVLVELTNGMYEHCIVVSSDPLNLAPYEKKHYVSEDKMYRGTFIPEYLRKGTVSETADGADTSSSDSSSSSTDTSSDSGSDDTGTDSASTSDGSDFIPNADDMKDLPNPNDWHDYSHLYKPCTCADGCEGCKGKDCGKSMLGHWGYEHLYCHCHDDEDTPTDEIPPVDPGDTPGTGGDDEPPIEPTYPDVPCFCKVCHRICLSDCPYTKTVFDLELPESILPEASSIDGKIVLPKAAPFDMLFRVECEDDLGIASLVVVVNKGETEAAFSDSFDGFETVVRASYNGKTVEKKVTVAESPLEFESFTCETETISIGKPLEMKLRFSRPVTEQTIVRLSVDRLMVCPERIVFDADEQEKSFTVVIWDDENEITAHLNDKEISCRVDEEKFPYTIAYVTATDDIVVGETFSLHVILDRPVDRRKTLYIDVSDDSMMMFPPTAFIQTGEDVVTVQGMFAHAGTGTVTLTFGESSFTKTLSC